MAMGTAARGFLGTAVVVVASFGTAGLKSRGVTGNDELGVLEIRNYLFAPGTRDAFIRYFEENYIESQEELGMKIFGIYRVVGEPDRLVWMRGFRNMRERRRGLASFYGGPVWREKGPAMNQYNLEYDDVRLVRPAGREGGDWFLERWHAARPAVGGGSFGGSILAINMVSVVPGQMGRFTRFFEDELKPFYERAGGKIAGYFEVEMATNDYPSLPVIQTPNTFFWLTVHRDPAERERFERQLWSSDAWRSGLREAMLSMIEAENTLALVEPGPRASVR